MNMCSKCGGSADAFLCTRCSTALRDNLTDLCWLADELGNAAAKLTALTMYSTSEPNPEEAPVPFNGLAHQRYDELRTVCMRWVRDFCDQEGWEFLPVDAVPADFIGPLPKFGQHYPRTGYVPDRRDRWRMRPGYVPTTRDMAKWLRHHWLAIVNSEDAALCASEIERAVDEARREINPRRKVFCGPCPTLTGKVDDQGYPLTCATAIWAEWDLDEDRPEMFTTCPRCRTEHDAQKMLDAAFERAQDLLMTRAEILEVLNGSGDELKVDTFKKWRKRRQIEPRGWKHGDRITNVRIYSSDPPVFRFGDARRLYLRLEKRREAARA